jgi:hypothetical protein
MNDRSILHHDQHGVSIAHFDFVAHGVAAAQRCASLARANDVRMKQKRDPASSACAKLGHVLSKQVISFPGLDND